MCLLIFAHKVFPGHPLVLAANRDEFYARKTSSSAFWPQHSAMLAGKDLEQGGTWMGITRSGRFAAITNSRDPAATAKAPRSRGELPLNFLIGKDTPENYLSNLTHKATQYAGFNLLLGDGIDLWYFSNTEANRNGDKAPLYSLPPGIYGLSNASLDTPWPKVELGKQRLHQLAQNGELNHEALRLTVSDTCQASTELLQQQGMGSEMEQILSAQFVQAGAYGTRSSTTLWVDEGRVVNWRELSFDSRGKTQTIVDECF